VFNAVLLKGYSSAQWKVAQIILIPKPGKPPHELTSYCPISLLPIISKVLEKLLLKRLVLIVERIQLIPNHQFGFRQRHSMIEQTHRIAQWINEALEFKQYCSAAFLDITQAFNKVWHTGLLYKLKLSLSLNYFLILKSYLQDRYIFIKIENEYAELSPVNAGVPKGCVLGPLLYLLFTADLPISLETKSATFADNTAVIATDNDPAIPSSKLQTNILALQSWLAKWRMKANVSKSTHITFTMQRGMCPSVHINNFQLPQTEEFKYLELHIHQTEATRHYPHQNVLVTRMQIKTLYKQQTPHLKNYTETNLDLQNTTLGNCIHFQHRNI
jgi:hypothetical protein